MLEKRLQVGPRCLQDDVSGLFLDLEPPDDSCYPACSPEVGPFVDDQFHALG